MYTRPIDQATAITNWQAATTIARFVERETPQQLRERRRREGWVAQTRKQKNQRGSPQTHPPEVRETMLLNATFKNMCDINMQAICEQHRFLCDGVLSAFRITIL